MTELGLLVCGMMCLTDDFSRVEDATELDLSTGLSFRSAGINIVYYYTQLAD